MVRISVDVGGTFTDVVVGSQAGRPVLGKALTTPERSFLGFFAALTNAGEILGVSADRLLQQATMLVYGTTRATNAIVEQKTAKTALLITEGFPDVLLYRQGGKERPFHLHFDYPRPYIPRKYTFEIRERINADGGVERPLDERAVREQLRHLQRIGIEAVAVCLLWSIVNDRHEARLGELIAEELPGTPFTLSSQLNPVIREYPRASSSAIDASLKPLMQRHLADLRGDLAAAGFAGELLISTSSGGVVTVDDAIERPIFMTKSGPAMAPLAGIAFSEAEALGSDVIIVDTGGTTFDVSLVRNGAVKYTRETWLMGKFIGHNLGVSTVDVTSIGAGGGSIAWVDAGGLLRVGPESAGAVPGPACYGRGGTQPTVTDAAVVLGFIDPKHFLGGRMSLDLAAAQRSVQTIADRLGTSLPATAFGIIRIASEQMIKAIVEITINDGINPRESVIVAGGGAAGLNILPIAEALGCRQVLLPGMAGGLSACGAQYSDIVLEQSLACFAHSLDFPRDDVNAALTELDRRIDRSRGELAAKGLTRTRVEHFVEVRYAGQHHEIEVPVPVQRFMTDGDVATLREVFDQCHERLYTVRDLESPIECINWKARLTAELTKPAAIDEPIDDTPPVPDRIVEAYFGDHGLRTTPVYLGAVLKAGARLAGPCIIEEPTTTVVVYPDMSATLTRGRNYLLRTDALAEQAR